MPALKDLVRAVQQDLPVTLRLEEWLLANDEPKWSEEALVFNDAHLRGKVGGHRKRQTRFRASGMGKCARARVFARIGTPGLPQQLSTAQINTYMTGNDIHRKWQRVMLTAGILTDVEVAMESAEHDLGGTADGIIWDGSLLEIKSINDRGYSWVMRKRDPEHNHKKQCAAYKLLRPELTKASILYENKNTGEWREYRVEFTDELMEEVLDELELLTHAVQVKELPAPLNPCTTKEGTAYRQCPFRKICLELYNEEKSWPTKKRAA